MCAWRVVHPNPMRAIVCKEVLAAVLVITSRATHFGLLPAGSKAFLIHAFCCAEQDIWTNQRVLEVLFGGYCFWRQLSKMLGWLQNPVTTNSRKRKEIQGQDIYLRQSLPCLAWPHP